MLTSAPETLVYETEKISLALKITFFYTFRYCITQVSKILSILVFLTSVSGILVSIFLYRVEWTDHIPCLQGMHMICSWMLHWSMQGKLRIWDKNLMDVYNGLV